MANKHVFDEGMFSVRSGYTVVVAVVLEVLILLVVAGMIIWEQTHPQPLPPEQKVAVITIPPNPPPPPPPPPKTPQPPIPNPPQPQPLSEVPPIPTPIPTPDAIPPPPPSPPPVATPPRPTVDIAALRASFESELRACIQAVAIQHYPREAILSSTTGTVTVSFDYFNGKNSNATVKRSSGARSLDRAGIDAVITARCPAPPPQFTGQTFNFTIPIQYTLGG